MPLPTENRQKKPNRQTRFPSALPTTNGRFSKNAPETRPLGAYIREMVLGEHAHKRRAIRRPQIEDAQYSALVAAMNRSAGLSQLLTDNCDDMDTDVLGDLLIAEHNSGKGCKRCL